MTKTKEKKVEVSFSNWVLGGSLLSVTSVESDRSKRSVSRKIVVSDVESDDVEEMLLMRKKGKKRVEEKKDGERKEGEKKDGEKKPEDSQTEEKKDEEKKPDQKATQEPEKEKEKKKHKCTHHHRPDCKHYKLKDQSDKTDDKDAKSNEEKNDDAPTENNNGGWTDSQDQKIKDMKAANSSWKEIAQEVGASKKDVIERLKVLEKQGEEKNGAGGDDAGLDFSGLFVDDDGGDNSWGNKESGNGNGNGNENQKKNTCKKGKGGKKQNQTHNNNNSSSNNQNQNDSFDDQDNNYQDNSNNNSQGRTKLQPDDIWNRDDCEVLDYLAAQYDENKWLHMQAGFYNWTGRMISAEMILAKFRDDDAV